MLPLLVGLTADPEFAAGAAVLGGAALLTFPRVEAAVAAGAAFGIAALVVPATLAFPFAALLATLIEWRPRRAAALAAAVAPFAVVAALRSGFGAEERSYDTLVATLDGFREYFWSKRFLAVAAVCRRVRSSRAARSPPRSRSAAASSASSILQAVTSGRRLRGRPRSSASSCPALPAYALLAAALPLLVPTLATRLPAPLADLRL